jgi:hypothetical protein
MEAKWSRINRQPVPPFPPVPNLFPGSRNRFPPPLRPPLGADEGNVPELVPGGNRLVTQEASREAARQIRAHLERYGSELEPERRAHFEQLAERKEREGHQCGGSTE